LVDRVDERVFSTIKWKGGSGGEPTSLDIKLLAAIDAFLLTAAG